MRYWLLRLTIILACSALIWFGVVGLKKGIVRVKGGQIINRQKSPFSFWLFIGTYFVVGIGGILFAVFEEIIK